MRAASRLGLTPPRVREGLGLPVRLPITYVGVGLPGCVA